MKKLAKYLAIGFLLALIVIQFIPVELPENNTDHSKDIVEGENAPDKIKILLRESCFDCHSNQTVYPWYSHVAPVSWLVARDTRKGRDELNLSEWADLSKRKKIKILNEIAEEVEEDKMPLKIYTLIHRESSLSEEEKNTLIGWTTERSDQIMNGGE
jgi:hypothetical protein